MKFHFVWVGRSRDAHWKALEAEYFGRLSHFTDCRITEIKDGTGPAAKEIEGKRILSVLNQKGLVVVLEDGGKALTSQQLAGTVEDWQLRGIKEITFVIGGAFGLAAEVGEKADFRLSLSFLTFTHEMARVVLLEQLYRAFTLIKGFPYQK